jgi:hypothetical protein
MIVYTTMTTPAPAISSFGFKAKATCSDQELQGWNMLMCAKHFCQCPGTDRCQYQTSFLDFKSKSGKGIDYPDLEGEFLIPSLPRKAVVAPPVKAQGRRLQTGISHHPLYPAWYAMRDRCTNPNHSQYQKYQAMEVAICERWLDLQQFIADFPQWKSGYRFKRIDRSLGFTPENYILVVK